MEPMTAIVTTTLILGVIIGTAGLLCIAATLCNPNNLDPEER